MRKDAETRKPACEQTGDPVSEGNVDLRQPSLTEPHHEHARGGDGDDYDGSGAHGWLSTTASASISTSQSGSMKRTTCIIVFAGRISPKNSPCTAATCSQSSMRVNKTLVRITSLSLPPSPSIADWIISKHLRA